MNAANEIAVEKFLQNSLRFPRIWETVEETMDAHACVAHPGLDEILEAQRTEGEELARGVGDHVRRAGEQTPEAHLGALLVPVESVS